MRPLAVATLLLFALQAYADPQAYTVTQVGTIQHFAITESSGLIPSRRYPGVFWTHNDSKNGYLFAIDQRGKFIGAFFVPGKFIDWEDIAIDDQNYLYLSDTGSNHMPRTHVGVYRIAEPNPYKRFGNVPRLRNWYLRFPEGPQQDCEAFFLKGGFGYLVNKRPTNGVVHMYRFSFADTRESIPLQMVATIPMESPVTAADLSLDKQRLALTTSDGVYLYFVNGRPASAGDAPHLFFEWHNFFMEGGCFYRDGFMTCAETRQIWFFTSSAFRCQEPVHITSRPKDRIVSAGMPLRFEVKATGCPLPQFAWSFNGTPIPGATNAFLDISSPSVADAGVYQVVAFNRYGADTNSATLTVRTKPDVRITEVSSSQATDARVPTADWFELTNFEPTPVDLSGWRFNDSVGGLTDPFVLPDGLVIQPGESIVLVENLAPGEFTAWWGSENMSFIPQIVTYTGSGLSFRSTGDTVFLWDNISTDPADFVTRADFGAADPGVTFIYNPDTDEFGTTSQLGRYGAVKAANSSDIGSPGVIVGQ